MWLRRFRLIPRAPCGRVSLGYPPYWRYVAHARHLPALQRRPRESTGYCEYVGGLSVLWPADSDATIRRTNGRCFYSSCFVSPSSSQSTSDGLLGRGVAQLIDRWPSANLTGACCQRTGVAIFDRHLGRTNNGSSMSYNVASGGHRCLCDGSEFAEIRSCMWLKISLQ